jgi:hypothetical protein
MTDLDRTVDQDIEDSLKIGDTQFDVRSTSKISELEVSPKSCNGSPRGSFGGEFSVSPKNDSSLADRGCFMFND